MKKSEEVANELHEKYKHTSEIYADGIYAGFKNGVEFAQQWISVKDELPKINNEIILAKPIIEGLRLIKVDDYLTQIIIKQSYTHWRPIEIK